MNKKLFLTTLFNVLIFFSSSFVNATNQIGDTISIGSKNFKLLSNNLITNPGFESGFTGWTDATTSVATLTSAKFSIPTTGGINNSSYLIGLNNENSSSSGSIGTSWTITSGKTYLFAFQVKYLSATTATGSELYLKTSLTNDKTASAEPSILINSTPVNGGGTWTENYVYFTNSNPAYSFLKINFRWLGNRLGFDDFMLYEALEVANNDALQTVINEALALYKSTGNNAEALQTAISTAQSFLSSTSSTDVTKAIADLQLAMLNYKYANATPENPLDMNSFIVNPGFESSFNGWSNLGLATQTNSFFPGKEGSIYVEKWVNRGSVVSDASIQQRLTSLPNGNYNITATAGNIQQTGSGSSVNTGNPQTGVVLFADYKTVVVDTIKDRRINFTVVDNQVTIGFKAENATGNWITCDNFRLKYTGSYNSNDYALYVNNFVEKAKTYLTKKIQNSVKTDLNTAILTAQQAIIANPLVTEDLTAAKTLLVSAINAADLSLQYYSNLQNNIDYANKLLIWYSDNQSKISTLQPAINTAIIAESNYDLSTAEIIKANSDLSVIIKSVDKKTYIPTWMMGDVTVPTNNWSYARSKQSKNWILFWEPGYGDNPGSVVDESLVLAEKCFNFYADSLKFITKGSSKTDTYKMIIRLRYTTDWEASGSGVDNTIALLTLTTSAVSSRSGQTMAHEIGHCFQYQTHCDNNNMNGWMYGFGTNASGGNGWWEQCAQWQAYKVFPTMQFSSEWFSGYLANANKNILNETYRYNDYFVQDYWCDLHGMDMIGRLWNKSVSPEDPVEAYKRLNVITQSQFNDEMWTCGAKFATWDIPALKAYGANSIAIRPQPKMNNIGNYVWRIDSTVCLENYGHNIIRLNAPFTEKTVTANFEGLAGTDGFRKNYVNYAGWRFGFIALLKDGKRIYGDIKSASMTENGGKSSINFNCPANCDKLWLVVSGAPIIHWRHAWDDNDAPDEQWPYQVRFNNTNYYGYANVIDAVEQPSELKLDVRVSGNTLTINNILSKATIQIYNTLGRCLIDEKINGLEFSTELPSGIYIVTAKTNQGTFNRKIYIK